MNNLSSAEKKVASKQNQAIKINLFIAALIIGLSLVSTLFEFNSLKAKYAIGSVISIATIICFFLIVHWMKSLDEFEFNLNSRAANIALYSSLFYLPFQFLSEIQLLPELHIAFLFMGMWIVYVIALIYISYKC